jgi:tRNA-specific 2-thiouridylase
MTNDAELTGLASLNRTDPVALALSGGVDSALAAWNLKQAGFKILACHLILRPDARTLAEARAMADCLQLELKVIDLSEPFERLVIQPFIQTYLAGQTPSPCVRCNPLIKFGLLWDSLSGLGIQALATGHYAGLARAEDGRRLLIRPRDRQKDQTYFLSRLGPAELGRVVFPLAAETKQQTIRKAEELGWPAASDSQDICFLTDNDYRRFITSRLGASAAAPGDFVDLAGRVLGRHRGVFHYTVGQRRGLNLPGPVPYYVLALDPHKNHVVIGTRAQTYARRLLVRDVLWHTRPSPAFTAQVQIRSRHRAAPALVRILPDHRAEVTFDQPQASMAGGQAAAFYQGDSVIGSGWIETTPVDPGASDHEN